MAMAVEVPKAHLSLREVSPEANAASKEVEWIVDSGATHHMCNSENLFTKERQVRGSKEIALGDASRINIKAEGEVELDLIHENGVTPCVLKDALLVPEMSRSLFSVTTAIKQGNDVSFKAKGLKCIISRLGKTIGMARLKGGLWVLDCKPPVTPPKSFSAEKTVDLNTWHKRFGHLGEDNLKILLRHGMLKDFSPTGDNLQNCGHCKTGKMSRLPFPKAVKSGSAEVLSLLHSDLMGPISPATIGGKQYVLTFIDDKSRRAWTYLLRSERRDLQLLQVLESRSRKPVREETESSEV